jgi:hypothetical protein
LTQPIPNYDKFKGSEDWTPLYGDVKEAMPLNEPKPRGKSVMLRCYIDSDHAGDLVARRSRTGYVQMVNMSVINWFSKKQRSVEGATFGREFVAAKNSNGSEQSLTLQITYDGRSD